MKSADNLFDKHREFREMTSDLYDLASQVWAETPWN